MVLEYRKDRPAANTSSLWFCFQGQDLLVFNQEDVNSIDLLPRALPAFLESDAKLAGMWQGRACYVIRCQQSIETPEGMHFVPLRRLYRQMGDEAWSLAGLMHHLGHWYETHQYCGRCGSAMNDYQKERALHCPNCELIVYPRISPAVIVAVSKGDKILLGRASRFPGNMHSVLAGFVEPGESLEDCVRREIREESGIDVKNIQYFDSQPWPLPDSLMVGFTADYDSGALKIDENELVHADWYRYDALPVIPGPPSIAGRLIEHFVSSQKLKQKG